MVEKFVDNNAKKDGFSKQMEFRKRSNKRMIFFDNNATTPLLPEALEAMLLDLDGTARNPSSATSYGKEGRRYLIKARRSVADYFSVYPEEIIFTSGATESNDLLIRGYYEKRPGHIITSNCEHSSVRKPISQLKAETTFIEIDDRGYPCPQKVMQAIRPNTTLMVFSWVNGETGVIYPIEELAAIAKAYNITFVLDAVAALGKMPIILPDGVSALSFSAHKCHGPKGVGLALIRKSAPPPTARLAGGPQESGLRAGTENLAGILGMAKAIELIPQNPHEVISPLCKSFEEGLKKLPVATEINGKGLRCCNAVNVYFEGIDAETLLIALDQRGVICSMGSACSAGALEPSHILLNMGYTRKRALSSLRFSFSRLNKESEINQSQQIIESALSEQILIRK